MTNSYKKEYPFVGYAGFGGGVGALSVKSAASKPYVDDVFSTYVYKGNSSTQSITNGIDISGKGGLVWIKGRDDTVSHFLYDTARGAGVQLNSDNNTDEHTDTSRFSSFNSDGFSLGNNAYTNDSSYNYSSWTFAKQKGFFDVVTFTGNGSVRTISHGLGSIPGLIMIKNLSSVNSWFTYHRDLGPSAYVMLNHTNAENTGASWFMNDTSPTATEFTLGTGGNVNESGDEFVAYLFAGGKTDATDKAVSFNGTDQKLTWAATSDFVFGTGAYTVEYWIYYDNVTDGDVIFSQYTDTSGGFVCQSTTGKVAINQFGIGDVLAYNTAPTAGVWTHYAFVRESTSTDKTYIFVNGELKATGTDSNDWNVTGQTSALGGNAHPSSTQYADCKICNFRITKGQALYTTNFNVPQDPLTTESQGAEAANVKVICCNGDTVTASTKTPGTITAVGSPTQTTDNSIFDDTAAYVFGDDEDKGIIKTGSYIGNGSATGPEIFLGWEPSFIILKNAEKVENWLMWDSMRGIVTDGDDARLFPNLTTAESTVEDFLNLTPTGFQINDNGGDLNEPNDKIIYIAIRRPDGYVGKPAEAGTDAFAMDDTSNASNPRFTSGFPVDFSLTRAPALGGTWESWHTGARLLQGTYQLTATTNTWNTGGNFQYDYNEGMFIGTGWANYMSWMWKRGQGFDVATWSGTNTSVVRRHNLGRTPEMIWYKCRSATRSWRVYHKGLNGGTNPENYALILNSDGAEGSNTNYMTGTAPTSTTFVSGNDDDTNGAGKTYIAMFFSSVEGISKVGSYIGDGTQDGSKTLTFGFQPRLVIIKKYNSSGDWMVFDSVRGNTKYLYINDTAAQQTASSPARLSFTSTGVELTSSSVGNENGDGYLYYAHA